MSRDSQRYRKVYSYYRPQPRTELLEIVVDETLDWKNSVRAASIVNLPYGLTGPTDTIEVDGVTIVDGDRVLLRCQDDSSENGIYYFEVTDGSYALSRASDARQETLSCGAATYVEEGTSSGGKIYILSTTNPITVGSTNLVWTEFSSGGGGLGGSGTTNYVSKFTASSTVGNSGIYDDGTNVGIGTNSFSGRFYISGSSTASQPTLVVRGGKSSPTGNAGLLDVQNSAGTSVLFVTGTLATIGGRVGIGTNMPTALLHVSGTYGGSSHGIKIGEPNVFGVATNVYTSLQHSFYGGDGSTLRLTLDSSGNILAGGSLGFAANTARLYVTGSSTASNQGIVYKAGVASPTGPLLDIKNVSDSSIFYVSASSVIAAGDRVEITGSLSVTNGISGSLTRLTDGTPYILAGPNITINTGSNGAVQITGSAGGGPTGSGTTDYLAAWTSSTTLGDSHIYYWTAGSGGSIYRYKGYQHQIVSPNDTVSLVLEAHNTTGARVGINSSGPAYPLDVIEGVAGTSTIANFRNNDVSGGTDRGVQMYFGAGNFNPGTLQLLHEWKTDRHYTRFRTTNLSSLDPMFATSGPIEDLLVLSSDRKVLVTGSLQVQYDASSQVGTVMDVRRSNGNQLMWMSSSAGSNPVGTDVFMWVSGSRTDNNSGANKVVFGGDVRISGSLSVGTGSVFVTANDIQFGSSAMRIQKNGNDMKFFDVSNPSGYTLTELAAGGGVSSPVYWTSPSSGLIYATGSVGIGTTTSITKKLVVYGGDALINGLTVGQGNYASAGNTALGINALSSVSSGVGQYNTAVGYFTLMSNTTGQGNTAVGNCTLNTNTTSSHNTAVGADALRNGGGGYNVAIGNSSQSSNTAGLSNISVGYYSLAGITTGAGNVALGFDAGNSVIPPANKTTTGDYNIFIGCQASALNGGDSNSIVVGYGAVGLGSNTTVIGNASTTSTYIAGSVGIGLTNPGVKLHVKTAAASAVKLESVIAGTPADYDVQEIFQFRTTAAASGLTFGGADARLMTATVTPANEVVWRANKVGLAAIDYITLRTGGTTEAVRISSTGNVGIGTTNPQDRFVVGTTSYTANQDGGIRIQTTDGSVVGRIAIKTNGSVAPRFVIDAPAADDGTYSEVMSMWNGKVGIGTTSPSAALDVNKTGGIPDIRLSHAGTAYMNLYGGSGVGSLNLLAVQNEPLVFGTNNTERVRISATGNVGIGTTGINSSRLFVSGSSSHANGVALLKGGNTTDPILLLRTSANSAITAFDAAGSLGIGTTTPSDKLHVAGGNVKVDTSGYGVMLPSAPSNAGANTLDCYDEKTVGSIRFYIPSVGSLIMETGYNSVNMTRVGRMVTVAGHLKLDTGEKQYSDGRLAIDLSYTSEIPLPAKKTAVSVYITGFSPSLTQPVFAYFDTSDLRIYIDRFSAGSAVQDLGYYLDSGSEVIFSVTYSV